MADFIGGVLTIAVVTFVVGISYNAGYDISRTKLINACIEANSDLPHNEVRKFCNKRLEDIQTKRNL